MSNQRKQETVARIRRAAWQISAFAIGIGLVAFVWIDRREIFGRLKYPLLDGDMALPYGWAVAAMGLLVWQVRGSSGYRWWRGLQMMLAGCITVIVIVLLVGQSDWARYKVYRAETFGTHFGLTARDRDQTQQDLVGLIDDPSLGDWVRNDSEMLEHLAIKRGSLFARQPDAARMVLESLIASGIALDEWMTRQEASPFLLYALAGETYVDAAQKRWTDSQTSTFVNELSQKVDALSANELEALFFCIANRPEGIDTAARERVRTAWLERVPQLAVLLDEGLRLGTAMNEAIAAAKIRTIGFSVKEGYRLPYTATRDRLSMVMKRSLQTAISLTGKSDVPFVAAAPEVAIVLELGGEPLYEYQQQVMEWQSGYERDIGGSTRGGRFVRRGRIVQRQVPTGETTTRSVIGATVALEIPFATDPIHTKPTLAYWSDYRRDDDNATLDSVDHEQLWGRVWPLGIHQSYFLAGADEENQNE